MRNLVNVGTINLNRCGAIYVSDPSYMVNTMCLTSVVKHFIRGSYNCFVEQLDDRDFCSRVKKMVICHTDYDVTNLSQKSGDWDRNE